MASQANASFNLSRDLSLAAWVCVTGHESAADSLVVGRSESYALELVTTDKTDCPLRHGLKRFQTDQAGYACK